MSSPVSSEAASSRLDIPYDFGSPLNFLSRNAKSGDLLNDHFTVVGHYAADQLRFAQQALDCLTQLYDKFIPEKVFDLSKKFITEEDMRQMERLFFNIAENRKAIFRNTIHDSEKEHVARAEAIFNSGKECDNSENSVVKYYVKTFSAISYRSSDQVNRTTTIISNSPILYEKYLGCKSCPPLQLSYLSKLLGVHSRKDDDIMLGHLSEDSDGRLLHGMGRYRNTLSGPKDTASQAEFSKWRGRVDIITYYAAKKALMTEDEDEAMKYAFIFAILRGYNVRSVIGAGFAQEMSLRWIFAAKGWPQFRKMPGVYLDIEACVLGDDPEKSIADLIERQIVDYKNANNPAADLSKSGLFDRPIIDVKAVESPRAKKLSDDTELSLASEI